MAKLLMTAAQMKKLGFLFDGDPYNIWASCEHSYSVKGNSDGAPFMEVIDILNDISMDIGAKEYQKKIQQVLGIFTNN